MAKDRMRLEVKRVGTKDIANLKSWEYKRYDKIPHPYYKYGSLIYQKENIFLVFKKYSKYEGDVFISFNPAKIMYGEVDSSNKDVISSEILNILDEELDGVFYDDNFFKDNKHRIQVSMSEIYIDIYTENKEEEKSLFEFIRKVYIPSMKVDLTYADSGTIYFYSGKDRKTSNIVFKIYKKDEELDARKYERNVFLGIIRFELV